MDTIVYKTGWFGVPGDMTGNQSTKVHVVDVYHKPICGMNINPDKQFQFCAYNIADRIVECKHCINKIKGHFND